MVAGLLIDNSSTSGSRIAFLGFGFEAVNRPSPSDSTFATRSEVMERILTWLAGPVGVKGRGEDPEHFPRALALSQNFPNPFNPVTTIHFALPQAGQVRLVVYNYLGQQVAELANGFHQPGFYAATFDGRNLASGIYFYRITTGQFTDLKKMVLVK